ncbi:hypothetical protein HZY88_06315 [Aerococcaceae bacterium DSM 111176]|nr:hypothetical protein [Aerococcaceae bacterium DSM 111176]
MKKLIFIIFTIILSTNNTHILAQEVNYELGDFAGDYQIVAEQSDFITDEELMIDFTLEGEEFIQELVDELIPQLDLEVEESGLVSPALYTIDNDGTTAWKGKNGAGEEEIRSYPVVYENPNGEIPLFVSEDSDEGSIHALIFDQEYLYYVTVVDQAALEGTDESKQWFEWRIYETVEQDVVNENLDEAMINWEEVLEEKESE